jgi:cellulose synthase/poly-beta-1,6-N-acetylglucosamine synthase-like glycosyltransferase
MPTLPECHPWLILMVWLGLALPLYSYLVFPACIIMSAALKGRLFGSAGASLKVSDTPDVAVVVAAYNEERDVESLLASFRNLSYPGRLRLYVGSDGSTDHTAELLGRSVVEYERVFAYPINRGKAAVLNDLLAVVEEPLVVLTDANTRLAPDAVTALVRHFVDEAVGAVCGEVLFTEVNGGDNADGTYWRFEQMIKRAEAAFGTLLGANGAIYAIRRRCFTPIKPKTIIDDFCVGMSIAAAGHTVVYEPNAKAYENAPQSMSDEFARRVRIGIGNYQAFFRHPEYLFGSGVLRGFVYFSHKVLRWFTPHLVLLALLANMSLLSDARFRLLFLMLSVSGVAFGAGYVVSRYVVIPRILRMPVMFVGLNLALLVGFGKFLIGRYAGGWSRSARS